jgi:hypothetical protein
MPRMKTKIKTMLRPKAKSQLGPRPSPREDGSALGRGSAAITGVDRQRVEGIASAIAEAFGTRHSATWRLPNYRKTPDKIIATLEKAPLPSPAQETTQQQAVDPLANFGPVATPGSIFDNQLYEAGATYARMLLGKKE